MEPALKKTKRLFKIGKESIRWLGCVVFFFFYYYQASALFGFLLSRGAISLHVSTWIWKWVFKYRIEPKFKKNNIWVRYLKTCFHPSRFKWEENFQPLLDPFGFTPLWEGWWWEDLAVDQILGKNQYGCRLATLSTLEIFSNLKAVWFFFINDQSNRAYHSHKVGYII